MKKTANKRRWVKKALIVFVAGLAVLTFFSNTIMNATIPRVMTSYASRNNLSYTNNATSTLEATDEVKVKGLDNRTVGAVHYTNYDWVEEGDEVITLAPLSDMTSLEELQDQLENLLREQEYANRVPHHPNDYTSFEIQIHTAQLAVDDAQADLVAAQNRDATISSAQQTISGNQANLVSLEAQLTAATASIEGITAQITSLENQLSVVEATIAGILNQPTNTPASSDPDESQDAETTTPPAQSNNVTLEALYAQKADLEAQIAALNAQIPGQQSRIDGLAAQIVVAQEAISAAQTTLAEAEGLPTVYAAQDALTLAQIALDDARVAYSDQIINDGIAADQAQDSANDMQESIDELRERISTLEEELSQNSIVAPISGYVFNMSVDVDSALSKDEVVFTIVPSDSEFTASFNFSSEVASTMSIGQELNADNYYWVDKIVITNIKPDPNSPRENRIVKCNIISEYTLWPGESITVTADRGNSTYDHVIAASALNEDNSGNFVFVVDQSSSPLGDKYVVRKVSVTVEARSGALVAISGEGLDGVMIVTRSEEPLTSGTRVRLEDYSNAG